MDNSPGVNVMIWKKRFSLKMLGYNFAKKLAVFWQKTPFLPRFLAKNFLNIQISKNIHLVIEELLEKVPEESSVGVELRRRRDVVLRRRRRHRRRRRGRRLIS
jgi:hypothetical protein